MAALPFTISFIAILTAHEFGHYLMGRHHDVMVSLPFFIPLPVISGFGTMGAFINMKEQPKNRRILLDIGLAGPLAGLVVTVVVLAIGLSLSELNTLPAARPPRCPGVMMEGNSLMYLLLKFLRFGQLLPAPGQLRWSCPGALLAALLLHRPTLPLWRAGRDPSTRWPGRAGAVC